jgi:hypothetical protein
MTYGTDTNPLLALLDDQDGLLEFHALLTAVIDVVDTVLSTLITWVTDSMAAAEITAHELSQGIVWGAPLTAPIGV